MIEKKTVYVSTKEGEKTNIAVYNIANSGNDYPIEELVKEQSVYIFTDEELKAFCKGLLDRAADNAELNYGEDEGQSTSIDKESIKSVLEPYMKENIQP